MWIDTHTHFDFPRFGQSRRGDWEKAQAAGVKAQIIMGVNPYNFTDIKRLSRLYEHTFYALGIHPLFTANLNPESAIVKLKSAIQTNINDPKFVGIGEIGLDGFVASDWVRQQWFFCEQLKLARLFDLPVFMHVRKAQDQVIKQCRQFKITRGIAHAFNGSLQQADSYLQQGMKLGFGGTLTFERARNIHQLINTLPLESFVLETDCPDMPPAWAHKQTNYSYYLPQIASQFAKIREVKPAELSLQVIANTYQAVPKLEDFYRVA